LKPREKGGKKGEKLAGQFFKKNRNRKTRSKKKKNSPKKGGKENSEK